jgi:hypothetical protein
MPSTYEPIASYTLTSTSTGVTFSSIPQTYTDLVLVLNIKGSANSISCIRLNSNTSSIYSYTSMSGNGSSAFSGRTPNNNFMFIQDFASYTSTDFSYNAIVNFMNYSNTTIFKSILSRANVASAGTEAFVNLWRNTAAINTILVFPNSGNFSIGSTLSLYGIKAA